MLNKENLTLVSDFLDFNYANIAFNVNFMNDADRDKLTKRLKHDYVNHLTRMDKANYFAIWNCDFQDFKTIDDIYFDSADHNYEIASLYLIDDEWYYQITHNNMLVQDDLWM